MCGRPRGEAWRVGWKRRRAAQSVPAGLRRPHTHVPLQADAVSRRQRIVRSSSPPFRTEFLRDRVRRGLSGVKLVISDAHEGIKAATARVLSTTWQRCRVHFQRNALAHAGKSSRRVVSAFIATAFVQPDHAAAKAQWRLVADQIGPSCRSWPRSWIRRKRTCWPTLGSARSCLRLSTGQSAACGGPARTPRPAPREIAQHESN